MPQPIKPIDQTSAQHYVWGEVCDGWHLFNSASLSIIQELVPAGAGEVKHFHSKASQFFYILSGTATLEFDAQVISIKAGQGVHVQPEVAHRFANRSSESVSFLVISSPSTAGDRTNI